MVLAREAVWRAWTEVRWGREHGRRLLGAADALAPARGVALAAVPRRDGAGRVRGRLAASERDICALRPRPGDLLVREPLPDRRRGALARATDGRPTGRRAPAVAHIPAGEPRRAAHRPHRRHRARAGPGRAPDRRS